MMDADAELATSAPVRPGAGLLSAYSAGALTETTINFTLGQFGLFYLTMICGLTGVEAGLVGLISTLVDAFVDPWVGSLSDNLRSPLGRRHPFMIGATLPTAAALVLLFSIPAGLRGATLMIYATVLSLALRIGLSFFQVPYYALGAELTDDYGARSTVVAARAGVAVAATVAVTLLGYRLFLAAPGALTQRAAYVPLAWSLGGLVAVGGLIAGFGTLSVRARLHAPAASIGGAARLIAEVREVFRSSSFRVLFSGVLLFFLAAGVGQSLTLYANTYFWQISTAEIGTLTLIYTAATAVGIVLTGAAGRRVEKRTLAITGLALILASQLIPAPLRVAGLLPTHASVMLVLTLVVLLLGFGVSAAAIGYQSMMADAADEHELLFGGRREGLYFAGVNFSAKATSGLGVLAAGFILDLIGFPHGVAPGHLASLSRSTINELGLIYGPGAGLVSFGSVVIVMRYRLDRKAHAAVLAALAQARSG
jgi:GPH family glycoside/pentoside/hexuronide:cation symporter